MDRQTEARQIDRATNDRLRLADTQMYGATKDRLADRLTNKDRNMTYRKKYDLSGQCSIQG